MSAAGAYEVASGASAGSAKPAWAMRSQNPSNNNSSSLSHSLEGQDMAHYRDRVPGKFLSHDTRNIPAFEITHGDYLKRVSKAFRDHVGNAASPAKVLAEQIECSDKTTKSWLDGKTAPSGILDLRAMNRIPSYAALKREIAAMDSDLDPRLQAKLHELHELTLALAGPP